VFPSRLERRSSRARRGGRADSDLGRRAADVDDGDVPVRRVVESAGRSDERQPRLLLVGEDVHVDARAGRDRACQLLLVYGIPDRRSGDEADRLATELPRDTHLGPDDFDDLRDLALRYRVLARQALADSRECALAQQLANTPAVGFGDQQTGRVRADVDARANHWTQGIGSLKRWPRRSGCCAMAKRRMALERTSHAG